MSASDAAPLPRLGEVFFDVRGNSRSMRLSWYADTGVAVFSIWQGGKCTGTFRLPIDDLPRMVEILQRGPQSPRSRPSGGRSAGWEPGPPDAAGQQDYPTGSYSQPDDRRDSGYGHESGYGQDYRTDRRYGQDRDYGDEVEYGQPRGYSPDPGYQGAADYAAGPDYPGAPDYPAGPDYAARPDYAAGQDYGEAPNYGDDRGYSQERVVPPYVRGTSDPYRAAYQADRPDDPSPAEQYDEPQWRPAGYSDGPDYRTAADQPGGSRHSAGRHGSQR
jgi:hypothetical protein